MKLTSHLVGNVLGLLVLILSSTPVRADLVTVNFQGTLNNPVGGAFSGAFTYDSTTPDLIPHPTLGLYQALTDYDISIGTFTASFAGFGFIQVANLAALDFFSASALLTSPVFPSLPLLFSFSFQGSSSLFPDDDLPLALPSLSTTVNEQIALLFPFFGFQSVFGTPTTLAVQSSTAVPEPSSWLLLGVGLVIGVFSVKRAYKVNRSHAGRAHEDS